MTVYCSFLHCVNEYQSSTDHLSYHISLLFTRELQLPDHLSNGKALAISAKSMNLFNHRTVASMYKYQHREALSNKLAPNNSQLLLTLLNFCLNLKFYFFQASRMVLQVIFCNSFLRLLMKKGSCNCLSQLM